MKSLNQAAFAQFLKQQQQKEPEVAKPQAPVQTIKSKIVIPTKLEDGTVVDRPARPAFLFQNPTSKKVVLPDGYYRRGSPEHLLRRAELEAE